MMDEPITIEEFKRVQLRVATVREAQPVPKSSKLLKLTIDLGDETRTLVAGIAETYAPEQLVGRQIVIVANLQPAMIRGIVSEGMLLAADVDDTAILISPDREVPNGSVVR